MADSTLSLLVERRELGLKKCLVSMVTTSRASERHAGNLQKKRCRLFDIKAVVGVSPGVSPGPFASPSQLREQGSND